MDFFRHCPQCGRRIHTILVEKKPAKVLERETVPAPPLMLKTRPFIVVGEGAPVTIDTEEIQYSYRCKHCGHEWSEARTEKHVENQHPTNKYLHPATGRLAYLLGRDTLVDEAIMIPRRSVRQWSKGDC
jgi:DNA-directed RNA polymerase subunit RPC12/RpoP